MTSPSRRHRRPPQASKADWYRTALKLRPELQRMTHRERVGALGELAKKLGIEGSVNTLSRWVAAANFLEQLDKDKPGKGAALRGTPVAAVEIIARWWRYDPKAALEAASELARGGYTVFRLRSAEKKARATSTSPRTGRAAAHHLRQRLADEIKQLVERENRRKYEKGVPGPDEPKKVDFLFQSPADAADRVAVVVFGPYANADQSDDKLDDFLVKVWGLTRWYGKSVGIVPYSTSEVSCTVQQWASRYPDRNITFYFLNTNTLQMEPVLPPDSPDLEAADS